MGAPNRDVGKPEAMLVTAKEFAQTAIVAGYHSLPGGATAISAFACELMLKTLAQMENGSYLRTHDLVLLFGDLPDELKDDVRGAFVEAAESKGFELDDPATHLDEVIAANRNTFVDVRYLFSRIQDSELLEVQSPFPLMDALWAVLTTYRKAHGLLTGRTVVKELEAD